MKNHISLLLITGFFLFSSCNKEEDSHPVVVTLSAETSSGSSAKLKGNVVAVGSFEVLDYGFVVSNGYVQEQKYSMNTKITPGIFELEASGLSGHNTMRAYITNSKGTAYGEVINLTMPDPTVSSISPSVGKAGDRVKISGNNFPVDLNLIEVKFSEATATIVELNKDYVIVEVPEGAYYSYSDGSIYVQVIIKNNYYYSSLAFQLLPSISDYEPKSGTIGTVVTITGNYFYYQSIKVYFNDIEATNHISNSNMLEVSVPYGLTTEKVKIKVLASGVSHEFSEEFTIKSPEIHDFSPKSGLPGTLVTVTGAHFGNFGSKVLYFGDVLTDVYYSSSTQFHFYIPTGFEPGDYEIKLNTGIYTVTSPTKFSVFSPEITGFSPESATQGSQVTISGVFLMSENNYTSVKFGTLEVYNFSGNSNSIIATVPYGVTPGKMKISVSTAGRTVTSDTDFTAIAPTITNISPSSGTPGTKVTITGTGFSDDRYYTTAYFGHAGVSVLSSTKTTIEVLVPSNVGTGETYFYLNVHGSNIETDRRFTIL